ncbi:MAG: CHAP domain-containing protein [Eubacterium sp.]|nr:CHAP domain-containing protein [Candidatus Colimonas fimequi]
MKKRIMSVLLALILAFTVFIPATTVDSDAAEAVTPRTAMPTFTSEAGKKWYFTNDNGFYARGWAPTLTYFSVKKGYVRGNCTWYALARASEIQNRWVFDNITGNADTWFGQNISNQWYKYGSTPKVGAIACYTNNHVAVVEKVVNGKPYVSESGFKVISHKPSYSELYFHYGTPWYSSVKGYIYVDEPINKKVVDVNYKIKITKTDLNMRTGPGTNNTSKGHIAPGTYTVSKECAGWGYLNNGYWVYLSYCTKIAGSEGTVTTTAAPTTTTAAPTTTVPTTANKDGVIYQIKVTATNLNMRTGAGTSYTSKGYLSKGTYDVVQEKNGWAQLKTNGYWISLDYATKIELATAATQPTTTKPTTTAATKATTTTATTKTGSTTKATTAAATTATTKATTAAPKASTFKVKITGSGVNMRAKASASSKSKGKVKKGKTYEIKKVSESWGQLKSNGYWINLKYTKVTGNFKIKITKKDLNMRAKASASSKSKGIIKPGTYTIKKISGAYGQLSKNGYWVKLSRGTIVK